jgi:hypothetical protein
VPIAVNPSTRPPAPTYGDLNERTMIMHNAPSRIPRAAGSMPPQAGMMRPSARPAAGAPYGHSVPPAPMMPRMPTHPPQMMMTPTPPPVAQMSPHPGAVAYSHTPPPAHVSGAHPAMHAGGVHPALQTGPHGAMHPSIAPGVSGAQPRISARPVAPDTYIRTRKTSPAADMVMWVVLVGGLLAGPAAAAFLCTLN